MPDTDKRRPAVFLDRDGVINTDKGYVHRIDDVEWVDGVFDAVRRLKALGYYVFVVTNQSGVARGLFGEEAVADLHGHIAAAFRAEGAAIDDFRYCPHHADGAVAAYAKACPWRKPEPGMIIDLMHSWPVEPEGSFLIGDKDTDIAAARAAGIEGYLFAGGSLDAFVGQILATLRSR